MIVSWEDTSTNWDNVADNYDTFYGSAACRAEDVRMLDLLGDLSTKTVLDVGCGTGWLLDHTDPLTWFGIDPAKKMLDRLVEKHPSRWDRIACCTLQDSAWRARYPAELPIFDLLVALYGSGSFLTTLDVHYMLAMRAPHGRVLLGLYSEEQPMLSDWGFSEEYAPLPDQLKGRKPALSMGYHSVYELKGTWIP